MAGRRRSNGEGTIYLRKDGRWEAAMYATTNTGTRKRVRLYGQSRHEVVAVGTALAGGPPRRSQRAELPHWAPTMGGWRRSAARGTDA